VFSLDPGREHKTLGLDGGQARRLHSALRSRTLSLANSLAAPQVVVPILVSDLSDSTFQGRVIAQRGTGFGSRFLNGLADVAALGFDRIVVVGTDTAAMTEQDLARAISLSGDRVAVGPSCDGGFYLLSLLVTDLPLLQGLSWQSSRLLDQLRERLSARRFCDLPCRRDLDRQSDFVRLLPLLRRIVRAQTEIARRKLQYSDYLVPTSFCSARLHDPRRAPPRL